MNKISILLISFILVSCNSVSQTEIELQTQKLDFPLKLLFDKKGKDSTDLYLCFPKKIIYNNKSKVSNKISRYNINVHPIGKNSKDYRIYKFEDSLIYAKSFRVNPLEKGFLNIYYGYLVKVNNQKLDSVLKKHNYNQLIGENKVYDISATKELKKWVISKINDSIKGQLHFKLHNKEKGFFYKSLDIDLFED
jgi:hypothetical protein